MSNHQGPVWVWPLHPLKRGGWKNQQVITGEPAGAVFGVRKEIGRGMGVRHQRYRPTAADLETLRKQFPGTAPENPSWANIEAKLLLGGYEQAKLQKMNAPTLVGMLTKVQANDSAPPEADAPDRLPKPAEKAGGQYSDACDGLGKDRPTDREAYNWLKKRYERDGRQDELPTFDTWTRNLRKWRKAAGQQKNKSRGARIADIKDGNSGSIVTHDRI